MRPAHAIQGEFHFRENKREAGVGRKKEGVWKGEGQEREEKGRAQKPGKEYKITVDCAIFSSQHECMKDNMQDSPWKTIFKVMFSRLKLYKLSEIKGTDAEMETLGTGRKDLSVMQ